MSSVTKYREMVKHPGKFEGEKAYVPYFWELGLNGQADRDDGTLFVFEITPEDVARFPELKNRLYKKIAIAESNDGFVYEYR